MASRERVMPTRPGPRPPYHTVITTAARNQARGYEIWNVRRTRREVTSATATDKKASGYLQGRDGFPLTKSLGTSLFLLSLGPSSLVRSFSLKVSLSARLPVFWLWKIRRVAVMASCTTSVSAWRTKTAVLMNPAGPSTLLDPRQANVGGV